MKVPNDHHDYGLIPLNSRQYIACTEPCCKPDHKKNPYSWEEVEDQ